jgi:hypothetical protein
VAIFTLTDATIIINGVTLSDHANQVTITDSREDKDATAFGATSKASLKGLGEASMDIVLFQDFAAGKTHATLSPLISSTTPVAIEVRATSAARSATNPAALLATALMFDYKMLDASIGDVPATTATFKNSGNAGMTYPTA